MSHYPSPSETQSLMTPTSGTERLAGVISHGSMLLAMPLFIPLVVLIVYPLVAGPSRFVRHTAVQALLFQLLIALVGGGLLGIAGLFWGVPFLTAAIPPLAVILGPLLALLSWPVALVFLLAGCAVVLWGLWIEVLATYKAFKGERYRMPIVGGFGG